MLPGRSKTLINGSAATNSFANPMSASHSERLA
jgi:hypothetical protein